MIVHGNMIRANCVAVCLFLTGLALAPLPAAATALEDALGAQLRAGVGTAATDDEIESLTVLERFYQERDLQPLWVLETGAGLRARQLADLLVAADLDALDPRDYGAEQVVGLLDSTAPAQLAELEVRLTQGLVRFVADLGQGRTTPHIADPELFVFRQEVRKEDVLAAAAAAEDLAVFAGGYRPQTPRYDRQKVALAEYRALATQGGWAPLPEGPTLKPGMTDPRIGLLRERLRLWGDLKPDQDLSETGGDADFYDDNLVVAVKWMQYRHGLAQDGAVGKKTLAAFNVPIETRIEQMTLNLERRRWMPDDLGKRHAFVNLADQLLKLVDGEKTLLDMPVVVGKPYHSTPVFSHRMTYLVINPFWNVPPSIARKELLPKIKQNASYLAENNFTLFSDWSSGAQVVDPVAVDWAVVNRNNFPYKLRQGSGDGNALGRVKFMFPNRFNIYLHDTPAKSLFGKAERTFSHGCIRVQDPPLLAEAVLAGTEGWPLDRVNRTIDSGERRIVTLKEPLPVHIAYLTSWVNKDGSVHFRKDVYGRDAKLAEALLGARAGDWR
ncbi:L,D-transpeptidase family protein [Pelagibius litoralis]|uniref:L,D-transpeptidase family protein n=1 Tax=Pelagibius litoralis TaxID=374515 RepID=A0A967C2C0_9PROT|nr:L,D-transpeptidase family protein [Pelagibius litoralis]NIA68228.1 L,D-transpeptidase family protein [Pelagibius litoralis]